MVIPYPTCAFILNFILLLLYFNNLKQGHVFSLRWKNKFQQTAIAENSLKHRPLRVVIYNEQ